MAKCTDAFSLGWNRMIQLLFQPFRLMYWLKMTFLLVLMNSGSFINLVYRLYEWPSVGEMEKYTEHIADILPWIIIGLTGLILLALLLGFLACAVRVLLYEGIRHGVIHYWEYFKKQNSRIVSYFLWNVVVMLIAGILAILLIGTVVFLILLLRGGELQQFDPLNHPIMVIAVITLGLGFLLFLLVLLVVYAVLLDSFVLPAMLVENQGIFSAWRRAIRLALEHLWDFVGYSLLRIVVAIVHVGILAFIGFFIGIFLYLLLTPLTGSNTLGWEITLITFVIMVPVTFILTFFFLPFPILQDAFTLSFLTILTGNSEYEPFRAATQKSEISSPPPTGPTITASTTGPIHFHEIVPESPDMNISTEIRESEPSDMNAPSETREPEPPHPTSPEDKPPDSESPPPPTSNIWQ